VVDAGLGVPSPHDALIGGAARGHDAAPVSASRACDAVGAAAQHLDP
jgi:hypothetical protein